MKKPTNKSIINFFDFLENPEYDDNELLKKDEKFINQDFVYQVHKLMLLNNSMSKSELAKRLDVSKSYVTQLFNGDKKINLNLMAKIQRTFNVKFVLNYVELESSNEKKEEFYEDMSDSRNEIKEKTAKIIKISYKSNENYESNKVGEPITPYVINA
ncbi:MAG: helix-turn-helix transcriptional regulator [Sphingobacteriaceae bacterium]|nr:helix-turn-helix transcriptional regulator [Sphingobacteriaceae bacterium]